MSISAELIILTYEALTFQQCDFENKNFVKKSLGKRTGSSQTKSRILFMSGLKPLFRRRSERISREEKAYVFLYFLLFVSSYLKPQFRLNLIIWFSGVTSQGAIFIGVISDHVQLSRFWFVIRFCCCHGDIDIESFSSTENCDVMQKQ